jgi:flagellar hook-basal body complex protein FliE
MDVKLKPFDFAQAATRAGMPQVAQRVRESAQAAGLGPSSRSTAVSGGGNGDFSVAFSQALRNVSQSQNGAQALQREVALDNPTVSIEQTMVAMQKAQIGFQAALQVRNRLVQAYSDIMNIQV